MRDQANRKAAGRELRPSFTLIFVFLILGVAIVAGGIFSFRNYERQYREQVEQQISAIADLKVSELMTWRRERLGDAAVFLHDKPFIDFIQGLVDNPGDADLRNRILNLLGLIQTSYQYDHILIVDPRGRILLSAPESADAAVAGGLPGVAEILASGRITFLDLHRDAPGLSVHMALVIPLFKENMAAEPLGAVILRIDPESYLYPFIRRWPTPSKTAETLLVRREGDEVLFLNELRFKPGAPLSIRAPLTDKSLPAAAAVLGFVGIMEGRDYRGTPVLADVRPVPDSPWFLVARMDKAEVYSPLRERLWMMIGLVGALLFGAGAGGLGIWRRQRARYFRERYETAKKLHAVSARQEALLSAIPDIVMEVDADRKYIWANSAGLGFFGEDVVGREASFYFEGEQETYQTVQPLFNGQENVIYVESWQRRKDGAKRLLAWWCRVLKDERGRVTGALSSARDVTEQNKAEEENQKLLAAVQQEKTSLSALINSITDEVWFADTQGRFTLANPAAIKEFGIDPESLIEVESLAKNLEVFRPDGSPRPVEEAPPLRALSGEEVRNQEEIVRTPARRELRYRQVSANPVRDSTGRIIGSVSVVRDITERVRAEEALRASLKEKEVLLREVHHRVKNNMQVISSLLNLQGAQVADPAIKEVFRASQLRIRSMALVHERLYGSGDLSRIDFAEYLRKLYVHLGQAFAVAANRIEARFDLEEISLDINSAIPCGLIATELISNTMKHAFPEARRGTIVVALKRADVGRIRLTIADDGVGFPPEIDFRKTESLGMQIVNMLSQQIEGRIEFAGRPGTSFSVSFPENLYKKRL